MRSLCSLVSEGGARKFSLGIEFEAGTLWNTRTRRRKSLPFDAKPKIGPKLGDLLEKDQSQQMSLKHRRMLAVIVAHAVLHFCEGPWLDKHWDKQHISFFMQSAGDVDLARPYLSTVFEGATTSEDDSIDLSMLHPCPPILALGVLLLELHLSERIEDCYEQDDLDEEGKPNSNTTLTAAERLLEDSVDNVVETYRMGIKACLDCDFAPTEDDATLNNDFFREQVYEKTVTPLEEEFRIGWPRDADNLHSAYDPFSIDGERIELQSGTITRSCFAM